MKPRNVVAVAVLGAGLLAVLWLTVAKPVAAQSRDSDKDTGLLLYFVGPGGVTQSGPYLPSVKTWAVNYHSGAPVVLYDGRNHLANKPVRVLYLPTERKIRVMTYYADVPPYAINKPYIFTVDENYAGTHQAW